MFVSWLIGKTTNLMLVACHSSYRVPNRSCVNGFIGTRSRWAQFIVCLFDIDLCLSCLLATKQIRVSVCAVLSLSPMASSVLPAGNIRVFRMSIPGHARLIHTLFEPQNEKTYLSGLPPSMICSVTLAARLEILHIGILSIVITNGADQTAPIRRQVYTLKFVVRK